HIRLHNPHVAHVDLDAHGYARLRVTAAGAQMRWYRVAEVTEPGSPVTAGPELTYDGRYLSR
ncbi:MAG TPA: phosphodiesterase, partial [Corynebacterium sp.]|nr:phosphodiesterase [Corynebacterium sp.]